MRKIIQDKKAENDVSLIFSIVITVVAISLALLLIPSYKKSNSFICKATSFFKELGIKQPDYCKQDLNSQKIEYKSLELSKFSDGSRETLLKFQKKETKNISFTVPYNIIIQFASIILTPDEERNMVINAIKNDGTLLTGMGSFFMRTTKQDLFVNLSKGSEVTSFRIFLSCKKPSKINIALNNKVIFSDRRIKIRVVLLNKSVLKDINNQLNSCNSKWCRVTFTILSDIPNISVRTIVNYMPPLDTSKISIPNNISKIRTDNSLKLNITAYLRRELNSSSLSCENNYCNLTVPITAEYINLIVKNASLKIKYYDFKEELSRTVQDCWENSNFGQLDKSSLCKEIVIPRDYKFKNPLTEKSFADFLKAHNLCSLISDKKFNCGDSNDIIFENNFSEPTNVLVKYDGYLRKVIIS